MSHYVGLDVSLKEDSICVVCDAGKVLGRGTVATDPDEIASLISQCAPEAERIVQETGILAIWLTRELEKVVCRSYALTRGWPTRRSQGG